MCIIKKVDEMIRVPDLCEQPPTGKNRKEFFLFWKHYNKATRALWWHINREYRLEYNRDYQLKKTKRIQQLQEQFGDSWAQFSTVGKIVVETVLNPVRPLYVIEEWKDDEHCMKLYEEWKRWNAAVKYKDTMEVLLSYGFWDEELWKTLALVVEQGENCEKLWE